jgi:tRNA A37 threonylcarbamoyladenosine modification protein TsaB
MPQTCKDFSFNKGVLLLADASGEIMSVCIAKDGNALYEENVPGGALENFFALLKRALEKSALRANEVDAFGFCRGPGSILGIRIVSSAFATLRAANPSSSIFVWNLLEAYAELARPKYGETFSILCPSRKGYANTLVCKNGMVSLEEIISSQICELPEPRLFIRQRSVNDKNFEGLEEIYFNASQIFELLKISPELATHIGAHETSDALTLAKREYVKWNSQAHS